MLLTPAQIKQKSFELRWNFFLYLGWMRLMFTCMLASSLISTRTFRRALTALVDGCADKECPFSGVTKSGSLEEDAGKRCSECAGVCNVSSA